MAVQILSGKVLREHLKNTLGNLDMAVGNPTEQIEKRASQ